MNPTKTATMPAQLLRKLALQGFQAVCEAFYPDNDFGAPSWRDADMVARAAVHWEALPPQQRLMLEGLYAGLELGGAALAPGLGPLSKLSIDARFRMFERMRKSRLWPLRFITEAVKSSSTMIYMSHPVVLAYIGAQRACGAKDAELAPPREGRSGAFDGIVRPARAAS